MMSCRLMKEGLVLEEVEIDLEANGQEALYIEQMFTTADTSDFVGSVRCTAPGEGMFTGVAVELDAGNRIFTTLPVVPVPGKWACLGRSNLGCDNVLYHTLWSPAMPCSPRPPTSSSPRDAALAQWRQLGEA